MATSWAAQRCLSNDQACNLLSLHRVSAIPVTFLILLFVGMAFVRGGWPRTQWPLLLSVLFLVFTQISLGLMTLSLGFSQPLLTVAHQLVASLLVAILSALSFRRPQISNPLNQGIVRTTSLEPCHG